MEKLTFFDVSYEKNHTIAPQGNRDSISKYLRNGYYVVYEQNGFWILNKSSRVMVYLKDTKGNEHAVDMKKDIINYYGKPKISDKIVETFKNDARTGKIIFYLDEGNYFFK